MGAGVYTGVETRIALLEYPQGRGATAGKPDLFPDFIDAAWVAAIAAYQFRRAHSDPARDPDVDRVVLSQRSGQSHRRGCGQKRVADGAVCGT